MRILLLTGGLYLLAVAPATAQEASDSTRILAVPATTPSAPNMQELYIGIAGAALMGACLGLTLRAGGAGRAATVA